MFKTKLDQPRHSLDILNALYEYDDFMESIATVADLGCGNGLDLEWWATRTTRDESKIPLNIKCTGVDLTNQIKLSNKYKNMIFQQLDFENEIPGKYDILWAHDSFQFAVDPLDTLKKWWDNATDGGMLVISVPQTTNFRQQAQVFTQANGVYYHHTIVSLIHMLAVTGWDCKGGFFRQDINDPWLNAVVYKSNQAPMDPRTTTWYDLVEANLLPDTADKSVMAHGYLRQQDLLLPWLDKSLAYVGQ
jgi:SAM-dependent methyltransferase